MQIKENALTVKGGLKVAVREAVLEQIKGVTITLSNGNEVALEGYEKGSYKGKVAEAMDCNLNIFAELTLGTSFKQS